jgi:hypothetical protein
LPSIFVSFLSLLDHGSRCVIGTQRGGNGCDWLGRAPIRSLPVHHSLGSVAKKVVRNKYNNNNETAGIRVIIFRLLLRNKHSSRRLGSAA